MLSKERQVHEAAHFAEPFLKWPGGKRWLWKIVGPLVPTNFKRYFEPFLGGGAMFFALGPKIAILSDINSELVNAYIQVRDNTESVIARLNTLTVDRTSYQQIRAADPKGDVARAVRFIYLSKTAFNGVYRVNRQGHFNVPFAGQLDRKLFDARILRGAADSLRKCKLLAVEFSNPLVATKRGDFVYCDPPYTVLHDNNGFLRYNESLFSWSDQERLAELAKAAVARGAFVLVSNAHTEHVRRVYTGFRAITVRRASCVSARPISRGQVSEYLFVGQPV